MPTVTLGMKKVALLTFQRGERLSFEKSMKGLGKFGILRKKGTTKEKGRGQKSPSLSNQEYLHVGAKKAGRRSRIHHRASGQKRKAKPPGKDPRWLPPHSAGLVG